MAYAKDVAEIFELHKVQHHLYADDMQSHAHSKPSEFTSVITKLQNCAVAVSDWCRSKRLQLNAKKTECMNFGSAINLQKIPDHMKRFSVGNETVEPVSVVQNLGVLFDEHLNMKAHISNISRTCFFHLRRLRSVRHQLGREITSTASFCICFVQTRLLQCSSSWITGCYSSTSSTGAECFSSVDPGLETTRSRHSSIERTALAPDQTEDRIQTLSSRLLVDQRPSSVLSSRQVDICIGSSWSRIVAFRTDQKS